MKASVRVMNSHDYSHFEVTLSSDQEMTPPEINRMRIEAQKLVDEAIRQYKAKKEHENKIANLSWERERLGREVEYIRAHYQESEWAPEQKAKVKALSDHDFLARDFDYFEEDAP
jgi:hypothetical protein